jgi:hypothetical protein
VRHQLSHAQKKARVDTSFKLFVLLDQYSELYFEGIAAGDESWVCYFIESDSMFARRRQEAIPRLRPGILIKKGLTMMFSTAQQLVSLNALLKRQKYNQECFGQNILPSLRHEKKRFRARERRSIFFCTCTT